MAGRNEIATKIRQLLVREDVEGLLAAGAPEDEYDAEAERIAERLGELQRESASEITPDAITSVIIGVWHQMFGPMDAQQTELRRPAFQRMAAAIHVSRE